MGILALVAPKKRQWESICWKFGHIRTPPTTRCASPVSSGSSEEKAMGISWDLKFGYISHHDVKFGDIRAIEPNPARHRADFADTRNRSNLKPATPSSRPCPPNDRCNLMMLTETLKIDPRGDSQYHHTFHKNSNTNAKTQKIILRSGASAAGKFQTVQLTS